MMRPKKSLGQNFLKSAPALRKIIEAGEIMPDDVILEIGPGKGALTTQLLASSCQLIAVERDKNLYEMLKIKFQKEISSGQLDLIHDDILNFDLSYKLKAISYKLIANIPYNITGAILKKFLTADKQPEHMVLMVQQEVAQRIVARGGKESILSISVKAYGDPKIIMKVPRRYFSPAPEVDSAILSIKNISRDFFLKDQVNEEYFWQIVRAGFAHKRKKLAGNLKNLYSFVLPERLKDKRAEELDLEDWSLLARQEK